MAFARPVGVLCALIVALSACSTSADSTGSVEMAVIDAGSGEVADGAAPLVDGLVAIVNGRMIDGTGAAPLDDAVLIVADGSIVAVGSATEVVVPDGALVIDARGGTVLPGLVDTHTHNFERLGVDDIVEGEPRLRQYLTGPLSTGLTSYRDAGSPYGAAQDLGEMRAALDTVDVPIPTITFTGPILAAEGNGVLAFADQAVEVDATDAAATVDMLADAGVDQIKIVVDDWRARGEPTPNLDADTIAIIAGTAHERGLDVVAHAPSIDLARLALDNGADELTHWPGSERLPDDLIESLVASRTPVGTTFGIIGPFEGDVRRLLDAGGTVVLSSDAPGVLSSMALHIELERMQDAGMTPLEVIVASTGDAAAAMGIADRRGTLEIGKAADVLVVDGDPLQSVAAITRVVAVLKDGVVVVGPDPGST